MTVQQGRLSDPLPAPGSVLALLQLAPGDSPIKLTLANLNIIAPSVDCWGWIYVRRTPQPTDAVQGVGDGPVVVRCNATPKGTDGTGNNNAVGCATLSSTQTEVTRWNGDGLWVASGCEVVVECHGVPPGTHVDWRLAYNE